MTAPNGFPRDIDPRLGLYRAFLDIWNGSSIEQHSETSGSGVESVARLRLAKMAPNSRQALLLTAMEGFTAEDAGYLMGISREEVDQLAADALAEIERQTLAKVLIIEDEPLIAMDLESLVRDLGHDVSAIATTHSEAVEAAVAHRPTLVLADIQLADDSSGIDAVKDILNEFAVPVIFITAFPERLLTGDRPEPAFLITKPFQRSSVKAAISQALFFDRKTIPA
ncbi:Response regulator receiver domain-containing protein [Sphingomonas sp. YR710]|nr:Response regulator receiver domain-containing protein [Sphingomonas sp. YR710]